MTAKCELFPVGFMINSNTSTLLAAQGGARRQGWTPLLDAMPQGVMLVDASGRYVEVNPAAVQILGLDREKILASSLPEPWSNMSSADGSVPAAGDLPGLLTLKNGTPVRRQTLGWNRKDGSTLRLEVSAEPLQGGGAMVNFDDITEHQVQSMKLSRLTDLHSALSQVNQATVWPPTKEALLDKICEVMVESGKFAKIYHLCPDASNLTHLDTGTQVEANQSYLKMFGYTREEIIGHSTLPGDLGIWVNKEDRERLVASLKEHGEDLEFEALQRRKNGSIFLGLISSSLMEINGDHYNLSIIRDISERKKAEAVLQESEMHNKALICAIPDLIFTFNREGEYLAASGSDPKLLIRTSENLLNKKVGDVLPGSIAEQWLHAIGKALDLKVVQELEYSVLISGEEKNFEARLAPCTDDKVVAIVRDITERKQSEEFIKDTLQRLELATASADMGVWDWQLQSGCMTWDERMLELFGITREEFKGTVDAWKDGLHSEDLERAVAECEAALRGEAHFDTEFRVKQKNGDILWIHANATVLRDEQGRPSRMIGLNRDITERKKAEEALRKEKAMSEHYLSVIEVILVAFDADFRVTLLNRKGYSVLGYEEGELVGQDWPRICLPPEEYESVLEVFHHTFSGDIELVKYHENIILRKNGEKRLIAWHNSEIRDDDGKIIGMLSSGDDITEQRHAEEEKLKLQAQLQQSQKMESLGILAGGLAHDMNNVLGAILGMTTANIEAQPVESSAYRAFDTISRAAIRGGKMVKSLLRFARQNPTEEHQLDMNVILHDEVRLLEHTTLSKIHLEMDLADNLRPILGDASALAHAFMNLFVNAVDAMPDSGTLTLRTRNVDNDWIEVVVEDNGIGMSKEVLEKAIDPFFTTKVVGKGTGLGLSMVYSSVRAHHGQLEIQSEPGHGTRVRMRFPACQVLAQVPVPEAVPRSQPSAGGVTVLLVDDDELIQSSMQEILAILGHSVTAALSGEEALGEIEAGFQPDVVILDMNMPGLGGVGTLPRLRALLPRVPVLLSTGRIDQVALDLASAHPGVTLLPKPFSMKELQQHLEILGPG